MSISSTLWQEAWKRFVLCVRQRATVNIHGSACSPRGSIGGNVPDVLGDQRGESEVPLRTHGVAERLQHRIRKEGAAGGPSMSATQDHDRAHERDLLG
jgi:hypothetical protein